MDNINLRIHSWRWYFQEKEIELLRNKNSSYSHTFLEKLTGGSVLETN